MESMNRLTDLPESAKLCFAPIDMSPGRETDSEKSATIDIAEVTSRIQSLATGETDAILFCMGLGGGMADTAPNIIAALRSSVVEPIFALVTLPCLSEGERCSSKAADDIETITPMMDGVIVFDNETWRNKLKSRQKKLETRDDGFAVKLGLKKRREIPLSPREIMYSLLNDAIVRRISLVLKAGEFRADGGLDLAEVVLDSGEVLNTMKGMGLITIGYAVEQLPSHPLDFLTRLRPSGGLVSDEQNKKASRIVDLAKQAIYHEISAPCDITSAHKALVLIAGPSHELSMKGFMTVRKWIDRSIAGLETRSGDYPVMSTKYIALIIMLSGLENIPRIGELKEIREQHRAHAREHARQSAQPESTVASSGTGTVPKLKDEMIVLPTDRKTRVSEERVQPPAGPAGTVREPRASERAGTQDRKPERTISSHIPATNHKEPVPARKKEESVQSIKKLLRSHPPAAGKETNPAALAGHKPGGTSEQDRRRIEQELHKQRKLAVQGIRAKKIPQEELTDEQGYSGPGNGTAERHSPKETAGQPDTGTKHVIVKRPAAKTVIIRKKSPRPDEDSTSGTGNGNTAETGISPEDDERSPPADSLPDREDHEMLDTWIRQVADQKKDSGPKEPAEDVVVDESPASARDDALLHVNLKRERQQQKENKDIAGIRAVDMPKEMKPAEKKRDRSRDDEDLSWVD
jgi:cell division GTPase FtsZ